LECGSELPLSLQPACWLELCDWKQSKPAGNGAGRCESRERARGAESGSELPHSKAGWRPHILSVKRRLRQRSPHPSMTAWRSSPRATAVSAHFGEIALPETAAEE